MNGIARGAAGGAPAGKTGAGLRRLGRVLPAMCVLLWACASPSGGSGGSPRRSSTSVLTREEMGERAEQDLYTIVQQFRPSWMQIRGQATPVGGVRTVQVVVDGSVQPGGLEVLRSYRGSQVEKLRYLNGQDATQRYGMDVEAGVIEVTTLRGRGGA
jgi:hypothetical protein